MIKLTAHTRVLITRAKTACAKAERARMTHRNAQRRAALSLTKAGISRRDAGDLLGISHQRVQQLVEADR